MFEMNILKQDLFFEKCNKIVPINMDTYMQFIKNILAINNKNIIGENVKINNMILNEKNTLVIDITSVASYCKLLYENGRIQEEYIKTKLENYKYRDLKQIKLTKEVLKIIKDNYKEQIEEEFILDFDKIVKQYVKIEWGTAEKIFNAIKYIVKKSQKRQYILIYSKEVAEMYELEQYIDKLNANNVLKLEVVSKNSEVNVYDNITIIKEIIYQLTGTEIYRMVKENENISSNQIKKKFFKSVIEKGERMEKETKEIKITNKECKENLGLNNNEEVQLKN